ncbi:hypothetical protein JCM13580A_62990 [Streptomyces drozdowiczii]
MAGAAVAARHRRQAVAATAQVRFMPGNVCPRIHPSGAAHPRTTRTGADVPTTGGLPRLRRSGNRRSARAPVMGADGWEEREGEEGRYGGASRRVVAGAGSGQAPARPAACIEGGSRVAIG